MKRMRGAAIWAALAMVSSTPALAEAQMSGAEKIHRLDVMLRATAAQCKGDADDFTADYDRFAANHRGVLEVADGEMRRQLSLPAGASGSWREMRRFNVAVAEAYDRGHPWLDCHQLAMATRAMADVIGRATLEESADQLIDYRAPVRMASAHR